MPGHNLWLWYWGSDRELTLVSVDERQGLLAQERVDVSRTSASNERPGIALGPSPFEPPLRGHRHDLIWLVSADAKVLRHGSLLSVTG